MISQFQFKMKVLHFVKVNKKNTDRHAILAIVTFLVILLMYPIPDIFFEKKDVSSYYSDKKFVGSFTGDLVFNKYYDLSVQTGKTDTITKHLSSYMENSDYITGNVVGQITENESEILREFKFTTLNIDNKNKGNNEPLTSGILYTEVFKQEGLFNNIVYQQINDIKVATLGISEANYVENLTLIEDAKANADLVFVHMKWKETTDKKVSNIQRTIAKAICDAGADVVVGHNAQVLQPMEVYNDKVIFYSLGNFLHGDNYAFSLESVMAQYIIEPNNPSIVIRIIPLSLAYGYPKPALDFFDIPYRMSVTDTLTSNLPKDLKMTEKDGILSIIIN
ncbi:MAG: poly-gamma-glutamate synthesis protein (capsule biosynthesis protein) [Fusobacteria bacterium]|nr:MAG: poly-gamma-glutamate synthesis protein (capsule biosynthesis protein) [Fusobacteriota bacterium]KAF0228771.1 MAG: poly-gamma-glutamate synthesis protein [Fusobacteriota bacterium]